MARGRHDERRDAERLRVDAEGQLRSSSRCRRGRPRRPRSSVDPALLADLARRARSRCRARLRVSRASVSGSIIVALIRVITSPPNGCCLLSIDAHRDRRAGDQVEQGRDDGRRAEVEGDARAGARVVSPASTSIRMSSTITAVTSKSLAAQHGRQPTQRVQVDPQLEVVDRGEQPLEVGLLVLQGRLGELDVALLDGRPQDHLAADADRRGLGPGGQRRHVDGQVVGRLHQAGQPPAGAQLVGA